jgi:hypothetical protein
VTQRPRAGLEALLVGCDILVEVLLERLVENGGFGMPRTVNSRRFASQNARIRLGAIAVLDSNFLQKTRRLSVTGALAAAKHPAISGRNRSNGPRLIWAIS